MERQDEMLQRITGLEAEIQDLQSRLEETAEALRAISSGQVDALVIYDDQIERIYTLQGADIAYRLMVESIHEGAAAVSADGTILYCNKRLAEMVERPLERVLGSSLFEYLLPGERPEFHKLVDHGLASYARAEFSLANRQGPPMPVLITAAAAEINGRPGICLVLTDLSEQKQALSRERELQQRLESQREEERARIARNLHDGPLQEVIGLSFTVQEMLMNPETQTQSSVLTGLRDTILKLAGDLRGVCNELRPSSSIRFGLARAIEYHCEEYQSRNPGVEIHLDLADDGQSIPGETRSALYRIFQECMNNINRHSNATAIAVRLGFDPALNLEIQDNGIGFAPPADWIDFAREGHLGFVGMLERADAAGATLQVISAPGEGTTVRVEVAGNATP